jgi:8-oxo-dGTP pyrophosphatase MutT (NUDIX family)
MTSTVVGRRPSMKRVDILARLQEIGTEPCESSRHKSLKRASVLIPILLLPDNDGETDDGEDDHDLVVPYLLLTKRSLQLRSHPGQVAFPGGKQDPEDNQDDVRTALREAHEEVGLDPTSIQPLCRLVALESINHLCVTPIVGLIDHEKIYAAAASSSSSSATVASPHFSSTHHSHDPNTILQQLELNPSEVEAAFVTPLSFFLTEPAHSQTVEWQGETFILRTYHYQESATKEEDDDNDVDSSSGRAQPRRFDITGLTAHMSHQVAEIIFGNKYPQL